MVGRFSSRLITDARPTRPAWMSFTWRGAPALADRLAVVIPSAAVKCFLISMAALLCGWFALGAIRAQAPTTSVPPVAPNVAPAESLSTCVTANAAQSDPAKLVTFNRSRANLRPKCIQPTAGSGCQLRWLTPCSTANFVCCVWPGRSSAVSPAAAGGCVWGAVPFIGHRLCHY